MTTVSLIVLSFFTALSTAFLWFLALRVRELEREIDAQPQTGALSKRITAQQVQIEEHAALIAATEGRLKRLTGIVHGRRRVDAPDEPDAPKTREDLRAELLQGHHPGVQS